MDLYPRRSNRLQIARISVLLLVALALVLYVFALPYQYAHAHEVCASVSSCANDQLMPADVQQLQQAGLSLDFYAAYMVVIDVLFVLVFLVIAALVFWRRPDDGMALFCALMLAMFSIAGFSSPFQVIGPSAPMLLPLIQLLRFIGQACIVLFFFLFPDGRFTPRWAVWLAPFALLREAFNVYAPTVLGIDHWFILELLLFIFIQVYRYKRTSNPEQRQQTKWVVFGSTTAIASFASVIYIGVLIFPNPRMGGVGSIILSTILYLLILFVPLSIGMAILRSHLWDIDLIIRRTLVYAVLIVLLALVYAGTVILLQEASRALTGARQSPVVVVLSTLAIASLFDPLRRRVKAAIDRRFFRSNYDSEQVLARFRATARTEVALDRLSGDLLSAVEESMHPQQAALWLRVKGRP